MTTSTERLRALLDERGVEYTTDDGKYLKETCWAYMGEFRTAFVEFENGETRFELNHWYFTPEQAINATLGRGECEDISTQDGRFICSKCGCKVWEDAIDNGMLNYCPDCGLAVNR